MRTISVKRTLKEAARLIVYKFGYKIPFTSPFLASFAGTLILFLAWGCVPDLFTLVSEYKELMEILQGAGITPVYLFYTEIFMICLLTFGGGLCWCRTTILTNPRSFEPNRIRNLSLMTLLR